MTNTDYPSTNEDRPQTKLLDNDLFIQLGSGGDGYAPALLAEYGRADQVIEQQEFDWGVLATITFPANADRPARTTHLVFGGCWEPQAREYLVSIGLGGVQITTVFTSDTVVRAGAPAEDSDDL